MEKINLRYVPIEWNYKAKIKINSVAKQLFSVVDYECLVRKSEYTHQDKDSYHVN